MRRSSISFLASFQEDFGQYGIKIRVKFRDTEPLQELSARRHSGGERSVSTVVYMMALQEMTSCPFRCVDEINQVSSLINLTRCFQSCILNNKAYFEKSTNTKIFHELISHYKFYHW